MKITIGKLKKLIREARNTNNDNITVKFYQEDQAGIEHEFTANIDYSYSGGIQVNTIENKTYGMTYPTKDDFVDFIEYIGGEEPDWGGLVDDYYQAHHEKNGGPDDGIGMDLDDRQDLYT